MPDDPRVIKQLSEALPLVEFKRVVVFEARAIRTDGGVPVPDLDDPPGPFANGNFALSENESRITVRFPVGLSDEDVYVWYDAAAVFVKAEQFMMSEAVQQQFCLDVGVMALYPYVREGISDLTRRLGHPVELGLMRRGDITIVQQAEDSNGA